MNFLFSFGMVLGCLFMLGCMIWLLFRETDEREDPMYALTINGEVVEVLTDSGPKPEWLYGDGGRVVRMDMPRKRPLITSRHSSEL